MAIFGKPKKLSLDEILKGIDGLSAEDKEKVHAKMQDLYKAEDEREIDKIEEDKADDSDTQNKKAEEVSEESEEIGKDVEEVENEVTEDEETEGDPVEEVETEEPTEETTEEPTEETETEEEVVEESAIEDHKEDDKLSYDALTARINALEEENAKLADKYDELYALLDKREKEQTFGSSPELPEDENADSEGVNKSVYTAYAGKNAHKYY